MTKIHLQPLMIKMAKAQQQARNEAIQNKIQHEIARQNEESENS